LFERTVWQNVAALVALGDGAAGAQSECHDAHNGKTPCGAGRSCPDVPPR